jgi:hypothetical protein
MMLLGEITVKLVAAVAPKATAVAPPRLVPVMSTVVPVAPEAGATPVTVGVPALIVNEETAETPLLVTTVTFAAPAEAIRLGGTAAVNCVALT